MSMFVPVYFSLGLLWGLLLSRFHPTVRQLRERFGERVTLLILGPTMLLWPVEVVGLAIIFTVFICRWLWYSICLFIQMHILGGSTGLQLDLDLHLICYGCGATVAWPGEVEHPYSGEDVLKAAGWTCHQSVDDPAAVCWFCPRCSVDSTRGMKFTERNTDAR